MNIKPLGNRILVKQMSTEEVTASGIVLPASSDREKPNQGIVKAVGSGKLIDEYGIKVGDTIVFNGYGIAEVEVTEEAGNKEKYKIVYVSDDDDSQAVAVIN
ncbi:MAG TPA: co-chaperone GroES [Patescibacteria group bacterium]|jgi:chaperonin GroES|nr:co-chaperone GroES [Patescibacteria group bacterium]